MKIAQAQSPTSSRWLHPTRLNLDCFVRQSRTRNDGGGDWITSNVTVLAMTSENEKTSDNEFNTTEVFEHKKTKQKKLE